MNTDPPVVNESAFAARTTLGAPFVLKVDGRTSRCVMYVDSRANDDDRSGESRIQML